MNKHVIFVLTIVCALTVLLLMPVLPAGAEVITFDGPSYVGGSVPPAPWTDVGTGRGGDPSEGVVYKVATGAGLGGSRALAVDSNYSYFEAAAVYVLPTALTPGKGSKRISVMIDPSQNDPYDLNFTTFGGIDIGHGGWMIEDNVQYRGVIFRKEGGNAAGNFQIVGPNGVFGYFVASAAPNWYKVIFDINAAFDSMLVTVIYPDGTTVTQTKDWGGQPINKIWLFGSNEYNGQSMYFDNLFISDMAIKNDVNGDGVTDLLLTNTGTGQTSLLLMNNDGTSSTTKVLFTGANATVVGMGDFNGDGICDLIKRDSGTGQTVLWFMNADGTRAGYKILWTSKNATIVGTGDFNGDGICDLIKRDTASGQTSIWFMNADGTRASYKILFSSANATVIGTGDFNGDGICDLLKKDSSTGQTVLWFMNADGTRASYKILWTSVDTAIVGTGDFNNDGICDLIKRDLITGQTSIWFMNPDGTRNSFKTLWTALTATVVSTGDFNGDGICDLIRRNTVTGQTSIWFMKADGTSSKTKTLFTDLNSTIVP